MPNARYVVIGLVFQVENDIWEMQIKVAPGNLFLLKFFYFGNLIDTSF